MLPALFLGPLVTAVEAALADAPDGRVAVLGEVRLARRLESQHPELVVVSSDPAVLRRAGVRGASGDSRSLPFEDGSLAAVVATGLAEVADWERAIAEWRRAVKSDGVVVLIDRGPASEPSRRALCGGLSDLVQRAAGRAVVTSGRSRSLD